jgi:hypothetical protein
MNTNANDLILAIDLGKYKNVVCTYRTPEDHQFTKLTTSGEELTQLIRCVQPAVVLVEACLLSGWVYDLCCTLGVKCLVANTASEAWKFKRRIAVRIDSFSWLCSPQPTLTVGSEERDGCGTSGGSVRQEISNTTMRKLGLPRTG